MPDDTDENACTILFLHLSMHFFDLHLETPKIVLNGKSHKKREIIFYCVSTSALPPTFNPRAPLEKIIIKKIAINEIYLALQLSEFLNRVLLSVSAHFWLICQYNFRID